MNSFKQMCDKYSPFIGRVFIAILFLYAAAGKIMSFSQTAAFLTTIIGAAATPLLVLAIILELLGALGLLFGFKTKWSSLALIVFTLGTIALIHSNFADPNQLILTLKNLAIIGGLLMYHVHGAGALALDNRRTSVPTV